MVPNENKEKFLEALEAAGNVSVACKRTGIGRASVYRWLEDAGFKKKYDVAVKRGRDTGVDFAESAIMKLVREGHFGAARFYLEANSRRYYKPRKPISAPVSTSGIQTVRIEIVGDNVTPEQARRENEITIKHNRAATEARSREGSEFLDQMPE